MAASAARASKQPKKSRNPPPQGDGWSGRASRIRVRGALSFWVGVWADLWAIRRVALSSTPAIVRALSPSRIRANSMNIHEYQAKEVLRGFGVPVPRGKAAFSVEEAVAVAQELGGPVWVVKDRKSV